MSNIWIRIYATGKFGLLLHNINGDMAMNRMWFQILSAQVFVNIKFDIP